MYFYIYQLREGMDGRFRRPTHDHHKTRRNFIKVGVDKDEDVTNIKKAALLDAVPKPHMLSAEDAEDVTVGVLTDVDLIASFLFHPRKSWLMIKPPVLHPFLRLIYNASCFSLMISWFALLCHGTRDLAVEKLLILLFPLQSYLSFMGDSVEFLNTGVSSKWQIADKIFAPFTYFGTATFIACLDVHHGGHTNILWSCLLIGTSTWIIGMLLIRNTQFHTLWVFCHITWHILPTFSGARLLLAMPDAGCIPCIYTNFKNKIYVSFASVLL